MTTAPDGEPPDTVSAGNPVPAPRSYATVIGPRMVPQLLTLLALVSIQGNTPTLASTVGMATGRVL